SERECAVFILEHASNVHRRCISGSLHSSARVLGSGIRCFRGRDPRPCSDPCRSWGPTRTESLGCDKIPGARTITTPTKGGKFAELLRLLYPGMAPRGSDAPPVNRCRRRSLTLLLTSAPAPHEASLPSAMSARGR